MKKSDFILLFTLVLSLSFASASFLDSFFDGVTGNAVGDSPADLVIQDISSSKLNYSNNEIAVYTITLTNQGSKSASYTQQIYLTNPQGTTYYLSPDENGTLAPGEIKTITKGYLLNKEGTWKLKVNLNTKDEDSNLRNNEFLKGLIVGEIPKDPLADVSIKDITFEKYDISPNALLQYTISLENLGKVNSSYTQHVYITNPQGTTYYISPTIYSNVNSNEIKTFQNRFMLNKQGTWKVKVLIEDVLGETNLENNVLEKEVVLGNATLECTSGQTRSCGIDIGICNQGYNECIDGFYSSECKNETRPTTEVCSNNLDDNCNGVVDENCETQPEQCLDGTTINSCSINKPTYCNSNLQLINNASFCGCPSGFEYENGECQEIIENICGDGIVSEGEICDSGNQNGQVGECNEFCSGIVVPECVLISARWLSTSAIEGQLINLEVNAENCDGKEIKIEVFENDVAGDEPSQINPSNTFILNRKATTTWSSEWQCDGNLFGVCTAGNPEYYFKAGLVEDSSKEITSNNELITTEKSPTCGNGIVQEGEQCDDANNNDFDSCSNSCINNFCGDGITNNEEVCDSNQRTCNINGYSGSESCNSACSSFNGCVTSQYCGDGIISGNEVCDSGQFNGQPGNCNNLCSALISNTCSDGTAISSCSINKPTYCNSNLQLVSNASFCGCPTSQENVNDLCQISEPLEDLNPELVGFVSKIGGTKDIYLSENIAYLSSNDFGLSTVDISDLNNPIGLGVSSESFIGDGSLDKSGDYVFLGDSNKGIYLIDVSNLRNPQVKSYLAPSSTKKLNEFVVVGDYLYVIEQTPANPATYKLGVYKRINEDIVHIKSIDFTGLIGSLHAKGNYLYFVNKPSISSNQIIKIYDISNKENPVSKTSYTTRETTVSDIALEGNLLAFGGISSNKLTLYDISNPSRILELSQISTPSSALFSLSNNKLVIGSMESFNVYNISNPRSITLEQQINTDSQNKITTGLNRLVLDNSKVFVSHFLDGILIYDINTNPATRYIISTPSRNEGFKQVVKNNGDLTYRMIDQDLYIINTSDVKNSEILYRFEEGKYRDFGVYQNYLYSVNLIPGNPATFKVSIYDISNPRNPSKASEFNSNLSIQNIHIKDNFMFSTYGFSNLSLIDLSNPLVPQINKTIPFLNPTSIDLSGNYLVAGNRTTFRVYDISNPLNMMELASLNEKSNYVSISGSKAYATDGFEVKVIDLSNPSFPRVASRFASHAESAIDSEGNIMAISKSSFDNNDLERGVYIYDTSDISNPRLVKQLRLPGNTKNIEISNGKIYALDLTSIVTIIDLYAP